MRKVYDFISIGSGFGGSVAALRLVEKGYSVLVIEKGKRYRSGDFPRTNWNLRKYLWVPALRFFGFQKLTFYRQVIILSGVGVGGGSLVYANTLLIPTDDYFRHSFFRIFRLIGKTIFNPIAFLRTVFNFNWSNGLVIFLVMQHIENHMRFVWKKNLFGGKMTVNNTSHKKVLAYIDIGQKVMEAYASKTGGIAQNISLEIMFNRPTTAHILGGCPMSDNIANGVIDDKFRVYGYPGMYIADGSAMQGNPGVNPSLSILAIAEYIMDQIPEKAGHNNTNLEKLMQNKKSIIDEPTRVKKSE